MGNKIHIIGTDTPKHAMFSQGGQQSLEANDENGPRSVFPLAEGRFTMRGG
jgi:hypothetical protein